MRFESSSVAPGHTTAWFVGYPDLASAPHIPVLLEEVVAALAERLGTPIEARSIVRERLIEGDALAIDERATALDEVIDAHKQGDGFVLYTALTPADVKALTEALDAFSEPVATVAGEVAVLGAHGDLARQDIGLLVLPVAAAAVAASFAVHGRHRLGHRAQVHRDVRRLGEHHPARPWRADRTNGLANADRRAEPPGAWHCLCRAWRCGLFLS